MNDLRIDWYLRAATVSGALRDSDKSLPSCKTRRNVWSTRLYTRIYKNTHFLCSVNIFVRLYLFPSVSVEHARNPLLSTGVINKMI